MMKKVGYIIIGLIMGVSLSIAGSVYGADIILLGKTIQGQTPVYLDGEKLDDAIIVDGKSYGPIRKIGEASGNTVSFEEGEIHLNSVSPSTTQQSGDDAVIESTVSKEEQLKSIEHEILIKKAVIEMTKDALRLSPNASQQYKDEQIASISQLEAQVTELEKQKAALLAQP